MEKRVGKPSRGAWGKLIISMVGTVFFVVAGCLLAYHAWRAQTAGIPMSNGQGGDMAPGRGFLLAGAMMVLAFVYGWRGWTLLRPRPPS
jgi:hypothetical protein